MCQRLNRLNLTQLTTHSRRERHGLVHAAHHIQAGSTSTVGPKDQDLPRTKAERKRERERVELQVGVFTTVTLLTNKMWLNDYLGL